MNLGRKQLLPIQPYSYTQFFIYSGFERADKAEKEEIAVGPEKIKLANFSPELSLLLFNFIILGFFLQNSQLSLGKTSHYFSLSSPV